MQDATSSDTVQSSTSAFRSFFDYEIFSLGDFKFTLLNIVLIVVVVLGIILFSKITSRLLKKAFRKARWMDKKHRDSLMKLTRLSVVFLGSVLFLESLAANHDIKIFKVALEFKLIDIKSFTLTVSNIFVLFIIFFLSRLAVTLSKLFVRGRLRKKAWIDPSKEYTLLTILSYVIYTVAILIAINSLGFNLSILFAGSAALLVGFGLGLQPFFTDIVSGFILLFEGTIKVNDIVEVDNLVCRLEEINIRTSKVRTRDGKIIIIPNRTLTNENVNNWSYSDQFTRFSVSVGVAYGSDTRHVKELLLQCASENQAVSDTKPTAVRFEEFADSSLNFTVLFWSASAWQIDDVKSELRFAIDKSFRDNNIAIPFPQRDLHIVSDSRKDSAE
jgi:small-conductance mechanosensitive channel